MKNKIFMSAADEFNNVTIDNNAAYFYKNKYPDIPIVINTVENFSTIYTYADIIHTRNDLNTLNWDLYQNQHSDINSLNFLQQEFPNVNPHPYWIIYVSSAKIINTELNNYRFAVPSKDMYDKYYKQRPYVVINGRNLPNPITSMYNVSMQYIIDTLILNKIKVINTTMYSPGFGYDSEYYVENDCLSNDHQTSNYDEMLAIFANANMVFASGNCGGIGQHILSHSNMCLCLTENNRWVDDTRLGYCNNTTIYDARKKISFLYTNRFIHHKHNEGDILSMASLNPPVLNKFFETKLIKENNIKDVINNTCGKHVGYIPSWLKGL